MKLVNTANIRSMLRAAGSATRAELAEQIGISTTTVRSLLCGMQANREILAGGQDASSGGRRAERYALNPQRFCGAVFYVGGLLVSQLLTLYTTPVVYLFLDRFSRDAFAEHAAAQPNPATLLP